MVYTQSPRLYGLKSAVAVKLPGNHEMQKKPPLSEYEVLHWTDDMIKAFWDYESKFPERYFTYQFGKTITEQIAEYLKGDTLDFGCGNGFLMEHLLEHSDSVFGVDTSEKSVAFSNNLLKSRQGFKGSYLASDPFLSDKHFDTVVCCEVLEHLYDPGLKMVLTNIKNFLREDGRVIFTTPNNEDLQQSMLFCPASEKIYHRWQHVRSWTKHSISTHLEDEGFSIVDVIETDLSIDFKNRPRKSLINFAKKLSKGQVGDNPHLIIVAKNADK